MLNNFVKRIKRAPWVLGQELTKKPVNKQSVISDLFVWRCNKDWDTYFELIDIAALFGNDSQHYIDIVFLKFPLT